MNKSLCALICFLVGILVYSIIRSYCSCDVIEGVFVKYNSKHINSPDCRYNDQKIDYAQNLCNQIMDGGNCINSYKNINVCKIPDTKDTYNIGLNDINCDVAKFLDAVPKLKGINCDEKDKVKYLKWFMQCPGTGDTFTCGGTPTPPTCPAPLVDLVDGTCPPEHPAQCAIHNDQCDDPYPCCDYNNLDFECEGGKCEKIN